MAEKDQEALEDLVDQLEIEDSALLEADPGDDEDEEEDEEGDVKESGSYGSGPEAPWAPIPTWLARKLQEEDPSAVPDFIFPTVYEEDRGAMLRDLATAQASGVITHQRMAEQAAKEFGFEEYNYTEEQEQIKLERKAGIGAPQLGAGDELAKSLGLGGGPGPKKDVVEPVISQPAPPIDQELKRADLADPAVAQFKRDMRQAEAFHSLTSELRQLREALASQLRQAPPGARRATRDRLVEAVSRLAERIATVPPTVRVSAPRVEVRPPNVRVAAPQVNVRVAPAPAPNVEVHVPPHVETTKRVERDKAGNITRVVPEPQA